MPAITSGARRRRPRNSTPRSIFSRSVAGSAWCTRWTSSQPGGRRLVTSSLVTTCRCWPLRRSTASVRSLEGMLGLQTSVFLVADAENSHEHLTIVLPEQRRAGPELGRRLRKAEGRPNAHIGAEHGVPQRAEHLARRQLGVRVDVGHV